MRGRHLRGVLSALAVIACSAAVASCSGSQRAAIPNPPVSLPPASGAQTIDGFPVTITEFPLPTAQAAGVPPVVGPDGAIWIARSPLSLNRVLGTGAVTVLHAPATPPGEPEAVWNGFSNVISYSGSLWAVATVEGGSFNHPYSIALVQFTPAGTLVNLSVVAADGIFNGSAISNGKLWLLFTVPGGVQLSEWSYVNGNLEGRFTGNISLFDGFGIAAGPDGNVYAGTSELGAGFHFPKIFKVAPDGSVLATYALPHDAFGAMAFGPDGALWIAQKDGIIGRMTTSGAYTAHAVPFAGSSPSGITEGSDGAMWFTDFGTNAIGRITMSGTIAEYRIPTADSGPIGIVSCPQNCEHAHGRLWFIEAFTARIARLQY